MESTELSLKELEVDNRSLKISNQQLQDELNSLLSQLQAEKNEHSFKETALQEQKRIYSNLQEETRKIMEQKGQLSTLLDQTDSAKAALEEEVISLRHTNSRLEVH